MLRYSSLMVALLLTISSAWAQEARGSIVGRITDSSGLPVQGASVSVANKAMGTSQKLTTNDTGFYQAIYLIPGAYRIEVDFFACI